MDVTKRFGGHKPEPERPASELERILLMRVRFWIVASWLPPETES